MPSSWNRRLVNAWLKAIPLNHPPEEAAVNNDSADYALEKSRDPSVDHYRAHRWEYDGLRRYMLKS